MTQGRELAGGLAVLVALVAAQGTAQAAELAVTVRGGMVQLRQGRSADITLGVSAGGRLACGAIRAQGVGARVHTRYTVGARGGSSGTFSRFLAFFSNGLPDFGSPGNCGVSWDGAHTPYAVRARVTAASNAG